MMRARTASVEADIAALKAAAERAGSAMACLFSSSDEFEAERVREWRARAEAGSVPPWIRTAGKLAGLGLLVAFFLMA